MKILQSIRRIYRRYTVLTTAQREWVNDLRSGKFQQGKGALETFNGKFCCLGVACKTYERVTGEVAAYESTGILLGRSLGSQIDVKNWLGMNSWTGILSEGAEALAQLNDDRTSFAEIADIIEDNAETLFIQGAKK